MKPEFLKKVAAARSLAWLPKIQAKKFRLDNQLFDPNTPKPIKEKLRAAAPPGSTIPQYKNMDEFKPAFENGKNLQWIQHELNNIPAPPAAPPAASRN